MSFPSSTEISEWLSWLLIFMGGAVLLGLLLMGWVLWRIKRINLPDDADFPTALRYTPLLVVITLDLFDFGLDVFSAPITWLLLGRLGLTPLRGVTLIEGLIPGTQAIPLMTVSWIIARFAKGRQLMRLSQKID